MVMANQIVVTDNLISYSQSGAGDSAVIFLHGWRSQKEVWSGVVSRINDERLRIYSLDLPGFGGSSVPKEALTVGDYAEIVKGFIEKHGLKNVCLVGHSFGGRVGIKMTAVYPDLILKLVLVDAAGFVTNESKRRMFRYLAKLVKPIFKLSMMQGFRRKIYQFIGAEDYLATPELQKTFVNVVNEDLTEDLKKINCPTLIIFGENDNETPVEFGEKMHSLISNSRFEILPDTGHFSFLDKPEEFAKVLIDFIV